MKFWFLSLVWVLLLSACSNNQEISPISDEKNICRYSKWLRIAEFPEYTRLDIINPDDNKLLHSFNIVKGAVLTNSKLAVFSSTHIGMLAELNSLSHVVAISDIRFVYNELLINKYNNSGLTSFDSENSYNPEKLLKTGAKVIVHSAFSGPFPNQDKLIKQGIQCLANFDWKETHPLGKAEWILLFGYLTGKSDLAKEKFKAIETAYLSEVKLAKRTGVKVISGNVYGDFWDTPAGESYHAILIEDAGGAYIYANTKGTGSLSLQLEKVISDGQAAKIWLNPSFSSKEKLLVANPKAQFIGAFKNGKIYCYAHEKNRFWEMNAIQPHLILRDYRRIFEQIDLENLHFYKEVK